MTGASVGVARGILRNAAALFLVGVFAKGMGMVIAILIARFLGAHEMGLFALLFSVAMLIETFVSIGMSDSLVRDVAARPTQASNLYLFALKLVASVSLVPTLVLFLVAYLGGVDESTRASIIVIAIGTPVSGAFVVSQAVLQGTERVLLLTWVTFLTRVLSLIWLVFAMYRGWGVEAAFISRLLFQAASVAIFFTVLCHERTGDAADFTSSSLITRSVPFALNRVIRELSVRLPSIVLPGAVGLAASGIFDSANRLRSTLGMTMSATIVGLMPSFARHFADPGAKSDRLVGYSIKYMCLGMSLVATAIDLGAEWIIGLLFGPEFLAASRMLQVLVWAQVVVAVDAVAQQALMAAGHEYAAVRYSAIGAAGQLALILLLASVLGLPGVALAVLLSSALTLLLGLRFLARNVGSIAIGQFALAPLAAAGMVGGMMMLVQGQPVLIRLLMAVGAWGVALKLFRVVPPEEFRFICQLASLRRAKRVVDRDRDR